MRQIGLYLAIFGVLSIVMNFIGYNFKILMWIDNWGITTGWIIRVAMVAIGLAIFFLIPPANQEPEQETA